MAGTSGRSVHLLPTSDGVPFRLRVWDGVARALSMARGKPSSRSIAKGKRKPMRATSVHGVYGYHPVVAGSGGIRARPNIYIYIYLYMLFNV